MTDEEWRNRADARLSAIETRLQHVETSDAVASERYKQTDKRLGGIEDTLKWLVRLIIGALLAAALTYALNGGFRV